MRIRGEFEHTTTQYQNATLDFTKLKRNNFLLRTHTFSCPATYPIPLNVSYKIYKVARENVYSIFAH